MTAVKKAIAPLFVGVMLIGLIVAGILAGCECTTTGPTNDDLMNASIPPIDASVPTKTETATFALGCFWQPDSVFGSLDGVVRTRVGYAGGTTQGPTYHNLGDHTETIQIDYDPALISYEQLLDVYWHSHNPASQPQSRQYMSIIFYHDGDQERLAMASKRLLEARTGCAVHTEIIPFSGFHLAEYYHQKHYLQQDAALMKELTVIYPNPANFVDSTASARINGYLGGHGTFEALQEQIGSLGLSPAGNERLLEIGRVLLTG